MAREKISIIIPCYNEGRRIKQTIENIQSMQKRTYIWDFELILSDDGSTDNTYEKIRPYISQKVKYTRTERNFGKGRAVYNGLAIARNNLCLILDADLSCAPQELIQINFDDLPEHFIVKGQRVQVVSQPRYRLFLGKCWQYLTYLITGFNMDTQCLAKDTPVLVKQDGQIRLMPIQNLVHKKNLMAYSLRKKEFVKVKNIRSKQYNGSIFSVKTQYGRKICLTGEHPLLCHDLTAIPTQFSKDKNLFSVDSINMDNKEEIIDLRELFRNDEIENETNTTFQLKSGRIINQKTIKIDEDFAYILGLFVAEGNISTENRYCLRWCMAKSEKETLFFIMNKLISYGINCSMAFHGENCIVLSCHSKALYRWFKKHKFAHNQLSDFIFNLSELNRWAFVDGYFFGDGNIHIPKKNSRELNISASTSKKDCAIRINYLLLSLGVKSSIITSKRPKREGGFGGWKEREEYGVVILKKYNQIFLKNTIRFKIKYGVDYSFFIKIRKQLPLKVLSCETEKYKGVVYDLTLQESDYFLAGEGAIYVHNCPWALLRLPPGWLNKMEIDGFAYDVEILMYAKQNNIPIKKTYVDYINDPQSSVTALKTARMAIDLLRIRRKRYSSEVVFQI